MEEEDEHGKMGKAKTKAKTTGTTFVIGRTSTRGKKRKRKRQSEIKFGGQGKTKKDRIRKKKKPAVTLPPYRPFNILPFGSQLKGLNSQSWSVQERKKKEGAKKLALENEMFLICKEYENGGGAQLFFVKSLNNIIQSFDPQSSSRGKNALLYHEVIFDHRPTKLVLDIETKTSCNQELDFKETLLYIIQNLTYFFHVHGMTDVHDDWFTILYASRKDKFSAHIIMHKGYVFANTLTQVHFMYQFQHWLVRKEIRVLSLEANNQKSVPQKRVSILAKTEKLWKKPRTQAPFGKTTGPGDTPNETRNILSFESMFDLCPIERPDATLRLYFSTKPGKKKDEHYRLRYLNPTTKRVSKDYSMNILLKTLVQVIPAEFEGLAFKIIGVKTGGNEDDDDEEERIAAYGNQQRLGYNIYKEDLPNIIARYTVLFYRKYTYLHMTNDTKSQYISQRDLEETFSSENDIQHFFRTLLGSLYGMNTTTSDLQNIICNIHVSRVQYKNVYMVAKSLLYTYSRSKHMSALFEKQSKPTIVTIKRNRAGTALCLSVKGCRCEIVKKEAGRMHEKHKGRADTSSVYFKIDLVRGILYQKCKKKRCDEKRGRSFGISASELVILREPCKSKNEH
ncbi:MAG: hypothetical protein ACTSUE_04170 [Promethearchaeota archaeon]